MSVGKRQLPQIADEQVDALPGICGKERADVDADRLRSPVAVPQQRAAAAAAQIDDQVVRFRREEPPQHVVADLRTEQRRRHALVARVDVQRLVQVFRLFGVLDAWSEVEEVPRRAVVRASASAADEGPAVPASTPWQSGQRTSASRESEIIGRMRSRR